MKKLLLLLLFTSSLFAQVAPLPNSKPQFFTGTGAVCSGCKLYTFSAGTVNQLPSYTDSSGSVQNTNPITMGSDGRPPQEIWLGAFSYDITLKTPSNSTIYTVKNVSIPNIQALTQVSLTVTGPVIIASSTPGIASSSSTLEWDALYSNGTSILTDKYQCSNIPTSFISANPPTVLTCTHTGSSGGGSVSFGFPFTSLIVTGSTTLGTTGNAALKYPSSSHVIYADPNGNDSNDGLSEGTAKLTPQACFNTCTANGTVSGTCILAPGSYSCPTTWYSNLEVRSRSRQYPFANVTDWGFSTTQSGALLGCTSGSNVTIGPDVTNLFLDGIGFNFANAGGGLVINSVSASRFEHVSVELAGSSTQDAVQLKVNNTTGVQHNTAKNLFNDFNILANTSGVGNQANGLTLTGQGTVNAGVDVTDNWFTNLTIAGGLKNAIEFEKNTDSNFFSGVQINNTGTAQGSVLLFNFAVPGTDQDADGITMLGVASTGPFSTTVSMGQSSGNHIQIESAAEVIPNILGGSPSYILETVMLGGTTSVFNVHSVFKVKDPNPGTSGATIQMPNGSAAAPPFSFAENTNTGFWKRSTLNEVIFAANGVNIIDFFNKAMRIDGTTAGYFFANGDPSANAEDTGITRVSAKKVSIGGTAVGDSTGTIKVAAVEAGGTAATISGTGACSTTSTQTGGANGGRITCTAATAASTFVITPGTTAPNGFKCSAFDQTTRANLLQQTSTTTTACTLTATSITQNDVIVFSVDISF